MYALHATTSLLVLLATTATAFRPPYPVPNSAPVHHPRCLNNATAEQVGNDFATLIGTYNSTLAHLVIADDYTDQSDSTNTLIDSGTEAPLPVRA